MFDTLVKALFVVKRTGLEGERIGLLLDRAGAREAVGEALLTLFPVIPQSDAETLRILVQVMSWGTTSHEDGIKNTSASRECCSPQNDSPQNCSLCPLFPAWPLQCLRMVCPNIRSMMVPHLFSH